MKPHELYKAIKDCEYSHAGLGADYTMIYDGGVLYVLFEESDGFFDWLFNLAFLPIRTKAFRDMIESYRVHIGYNLIYKSIRKRILEELRFVLNMVAPTRVICAGWSHGGALAQRLAEDIGFSLGFKADIVTFGAPMPFYADAVDIVRPRVGTVTLYKARGDLVTELPFKKLGFRPMVPETIVGTEEFKTLSEKIRGVVKAHTSYGNPELYEGVKDNENQTV
jgi:hypothetical protein